MKIAELARQVHENAVAHGWWEENREFPEINALIHSEWSEALEEARAGRPMVWYKPNIEKACWRNNCNAYISIGHICHGQFSAAEHPTNNGCPENMKPEGVAVELIDGCIRILDYFGKIKAEFHDSDNAESTIEGLYSDSNVAKVPDKLPELVAYLHQYTASALLKYDDLVFADTFSLLATMAAALSWVKKQGLDPLAILLEKHEYNKTRAYKHGKKF